MKKCVFKVLSTMVYYLDLEYMRLLANRHAIKTDFLLEFISCFIRDNATTNILVILIRLFIFPLSCMLLCSSFVRYSSFHCKLKVKKNIAKNHVIILLFTSILGCNNEARTPSKCGALHGRSYKAPSSVHSDRIFA